MKDNKNGSQVNYQFLGVISDDIVGGFSFFRAILSDKTKAG